MCSRSVLLSACLGAIVFPVAKTAAVYSPQAERACLQRGENSRLHKTVQQDSRQETSSQTGAKAPVLRAEGTAQPVKHAKSAGAKPDALAKCEDTNTTGAKFEALSAVYASPTADKDSVAAPAFVDTSTLWLARAIYSETKDPQEQELIAWVVRNRVETRYRGHSSYKEVVLDPYQFSAFNPGRPKRSFYIGLTPKAERPGWTKALWIAKYVRHAPARHRPFPIRTRHFYSEQSMEKQRRPYWADHQKRTLPAGGFEINKKRFRFYVGIS